MLEIKNKKINIFFSVIMFLIIALFCIVPIFGQSTNSTVNDTVIKTASVVSTVPPDINSFNIILMQENKLIDSFPFSEKTFPAKSSDFVDNFYKFKDNCKIRNYEKIMFSKYDFYHHSGNTKFGFDLEFTNGKIFIDTMSCGSIHNVYIFEFTIKFSDGTFLKDKFSSACEDYAMLYDFSSMPNDILVEFTKISIINVVEFDNTVTVLPKPRVIFSSDYIQSSDYGFYPVSFNVKNKSFIYEIEPTIVKNDNSTIAPTPAPVTPVDLNNSKKSNWFSNEGQRIKSQFISLGKWQPEGFLKWECITILSIAFIICLSAIVLVSCKINKNIRHSNNRHKRKNKKYRRR